MLPEVKFQNIQKYLLLKGWFENNYDEKLKKFTLGSEIPSVELLVPVNENLSDYSSRVNDLIMSLSVLEEREREVIQNEILYVGYDLMKIRLKDQYIKDGGISVSDFWYVMDKIERMLTFGACSEIVEKSQYTRPYDEAVDLVDNCQFIKHEAGSFVFFIRIPWGETYIRDIQTVIEEEGDYVKDLGRRTIARLIDGIEKAKEFDIENENEFKRGYDKKLNGNVCSAIAELISEDYEELQVQFSAVLNSVHPSEDFHIGVAEISTNNDHKRFARMFSYLKNVPEEQLVIIKGKIPMIHISGQDTLTEEKRMITILETPLKRKVNLLLNLEDFKLACDALRDSKTVSVTGKLNKRSNKWYLDEPTEFTVR